MWSPSVAAAAIRTGARYLATKSWSGSEMLEQELYVRMKLREIQLPAPAPAASRPGSVARRRKGGLSGVVRRAVPWLAGNFTDLQDATPRPETRS